MYMLNRLDVLFSAVDRARRLEVDSAGDLEMYRRTIWRGPNQGKSTAEWEKQFGVEALRVYPELKACCDELMRMNVALQDEVRNLKIKNLELEDRIK